MSKKSADDKPVAGGAGEKSTRKVTVSQEEEMEGSRGRRGIWERRHRRRRWKEVEDGEESESGDEIHELWALSEYILFLTI